MASGTAAGPVNARAPVASLPSRASGAALLAVAGPENAARTSLSGAAAATIATGAATSARTVGAGSTTVGSGAARAGLTAGSTSATVRTGGSGTNPGVATAGTAGAALTTVTAGAGGLVLLAAYSLGLGLPFLLATLFTDRLLGLGRGLGRFGRLLNLAAGGVMIGMGLAMMTGRLTEIGSWLLETWPAFGRIG